MSDEDMEKEIVDKGLTYPRVTNDEIEEKMKGVGYHCHVIPGTTTTVITATLPMGHINFTLGTDIMACVDPRNFNAELGVKYGIEKVSKIAKDKLWELEGYRLAHQIANTPKDAQERVVVELNTLNANIARLSAYLDSDHFNSLDDIDKELLVCQSAAMSKYSETISTRLARWKY